jgi:hypothetical protein
MRGSFLQSALPSATSLPNRCKLSSVPQYPSPAPQQSSNAVKTLPPPPSLTWPIIFPNGQAHAPLLNILSAGQCCASGSGRIRNQGLSRIRIRKKVVFFGSTTLLMERFYESLTSPPVMFYEPCVKIRQVLHPPPPHCICSGTCSLPRCDSASRSWCCPHSPNLISQCCTSQIHFILKRIGI